MENKVNTILITVGILFFIVAIYFYTVPNTIQNQTITLDPSTDEIKKIMLEQGDRVQVDLIIHNGIDGINVHVIGPTEEIVYSGGKVYTSLQFTFSSQVSGSYEIKFNNSSPTNNQTLEYTVSYPSYPGIIKFITNAIGAILLGLGLSRTYISRKKGQIE